MMKPTNCECKFVWSSLGHVKLTLLIRIQNVSLHSLFVWINQQYLPTWKLPGTYALGISNTFSRPVYYVFVWDTRVYFFMSWPYAALWDCNGLRLCLQLGSRDYFLNSEAEQVMAHDKFTRETRRLLITYNIHLQAHQSSYLPNCLTVYVHIIYLLCHLELEISLTLLHAEPLPWKLSLPKLKWYLWTGLCDNS